MKSFKQFILTERPDSRLAEAFRKIAKAKESRKNAAK